MTDQVIIGMDPHKASNTIAVLARDATLLTRRRFANSDDGFVEMLAAVDESTGGGVDDRSNRLTGLTVATAILAAAGMAACSSATADFTSAELRAVIEADATVFDDDTIPAVVVDRLAEHRVVLLGETHHLREHWEFVAALMSELYDDGFRQLLIEAPHMASWLLDDYVQGSPNRPEWTAPPFYARRLSLIRDFNLAHSEDPIHVRGIDANEDFYGGAGDFHLLLGWFVDTLPTSGPTESVLRMSYATSDSEAQRQAIDDLHQRLEAERSDLVGTWGVERYEELLELLTIERSSIEVRAARSDDDDRGARAREDLIKRLADDRISECECATVINIGGHHAQKSHLMGTDQEWLGDYLTHASEVVDGSTFVIGISSARTDLEPGAEGTPWSVVNSRSPGNELLRTMAETAPGRTVFIPLDDPLFADRTVAYNSEDVIYVTSLGEQFDAVMQYGIAHRMPVD
jgi:hypothetical protein